MKHDTSDKTQPATPTPKKDAPHQAALKVLSRFAMDEDEEDAPDQCSCCGGDNTRPSPCCGG